MKDFPDRVNNLPPAVLDDIEAVLLRHMGTDASMGIVIVFTPRDVPDDDERRMACMANIPQQLIPQMLLKAMQQVSENLPEQLRTKLHLDS